MQLCKCLLGPTDVRVGLVEGGHLRLLETDRTLSEFLHAESPARLVRDLTPNSQQMLPLSDVTLLAPVNRQEVWAAGVTYTRSREARERESVGAAKFYELVYTAARPELFFKATAARVVHPGRPVHVRRDSRWSVPEPELALVLSPELKIVGYTIGNDMSARDIEGENPLYLPQAKIYDNACALGPVVTLAAALPPGDQVTIRLVIERDGRTAFDGSTRLSAMARRLEDLAQWLGRETSFSDGAVLLTGTGVVPPDDFSLAPGDRISIDITGIGRLTNPVTVTGR